MTFKKIRKVLKFVWNNPHSSFYRNKYSKLGINLIKDINSMDDFKKLPFLTKEEIVKIDPYERLYLPMDKLSTVGISSGTSSGELSIVFKAKTSQVTEKVIDEQNIKCMMFLLPPLRSVQRTFTNLKVESGSKRIRIAADLNNLPLSAKIAARLKVDALVGSPTSLYFFIPYLRQEYDLRNVKFVKLDGEYCSVQKALFLKENFGKARIVQSYGISENDGFVGLYCPFLDPLLTGYFHLNPEIYYEAVDAGAGKELVLTNLLTNMFPLIRYKTGDEIEMEDFKCKCGQLQRFKILGRISFDTARIHGTFIYAKLIDKVLAPFRQYLASPEWQLHIFEDLKRDKIVPRLILQLILKKGLESGSAQKTISEGVSRELYLSAKKTLADLVKEGIFLPLEVEFVESFPEGVKHRYIVPHLG